MADPRDREGEVVDWTIDQDAWRLTSYVGGSCVLERKHAETGLVVGRLDGLVDADLDDLGRVLGARAALDA